MKPRPLRKGRPPFRDHRLSSDSSRPASPITRQLVGSTVPEIYFAREIGACYAAAYLVVDHANGAGLQVERPRFIHDDKVDGTWKTENEAYIEGCKRFGPNPFLVMLIESPEPPTPVFQEITRCPSSSGH
jgi:hypothetical protein